MDNDVFSVAILIHPKIQIRERSQPLKVTDNLYSVIDDGTLFVKVFDDTDDVILR